MWLMTARGFYSVVEHRDDPARLHVEGGPHIRAVVGSALPTNSTSAERRRIGAQVIALLACPDQRRAR